jgi:hypothetical protein
MSEDISPPPHFRELYKCFNKEISVTWLAKVLPILLPPRELYLVITLFAPVQILLEIYEGYSESNLR